MGKQAIGGGFAGPGGMKLPFPKAVRAGDFVFVSGQMALDASGQLVDGGIEVQTRQVMDNIKITRRLPASVDIHQAEDFRRSLIRIRSRPNTSSCGTLRRRSQPRLDARLMCSSCE